MHALWMVLAAFFFATMAVGIKFASSDFGTMELVFYRGVSAWCLWAWWYARAAPACAPLCP